ERYISPEAAWQVSNILAGLPPPSGAPSGVIAYKTGTSYGHRDAWAIGFDGGHVVGVWMGRADGTPVPGAFGGVLAAPVLFDAFGRLKPTLERLPPPPPATLVVEAAALPPPLARFRPRGAITDLAGEGLELSFPPDGSTLQQNHDGLTMKLRGGTPPFTVFSNGKPLPRKQRRREFSIPDPGLGYSTLVVVDKLGRSDRINIWLD
ncbi:MAG: penicillin-binding protein 1C, partial [Pseudomonadota bacterium]